MDSRSLRRYDATMWTALGTGLSTVLELALPRCCAGCDAPDPAAQPFCRRCAEALLTQLSQPYCLRCGAGIGEGLGVPDDGCVACPTPMPRFDNLVRLGPYADPIAAAVRLFKFRRQTALARRLGTLLAERVKIDVNMSSVDCIQPIPLHWWRQFQRGFNPADLLARRLGRMLGLPVAAMLTRTRNTPPQVHLPRTRRLENVRGAFACTARRRDLAGLHVLLVDDVTTTGATASEAARTLLEAGAARVSLAVLAKAELHAPYTPRHAR